MVHRKAVTVAAVVALGIGSLAAQASSAEAVPNNCSKWVTLQSDFMWAHSRCNGGFGEQRVRTYCSWFGAGYTAYGPWVKKGNTSTAACGRYASATSITIELRDV